MLSKGLTVKQLEERLRASHPAMMEALAANEEHPVLRKRAAHDQIALALSEAIRGGLVRRERVHVKNAARAGIDAMIDVYRLTKEPR